MVIGTTLRDAVLHLLVKNGEVDQTLTLQQVKGLRNAMLASPELLTACQAIYTKLTKNAETDYAHLNWGNEKKLLKEAIEKATGEKLTLVQQIASRFKSANKPKKPETKEEAIKAEKQLMADFSKAVGE